MSLALYSPCAYPLIKQGFRRPSSANHLPGESRGIVEKENSDESSENKPLTKAILDVLEKQRQKTEAVGDTDVQEPPKRQVKFLTPPSSFAKKTRIPSASYPRGKLRDSNSSETLGEMTEKEEKASLIETMKLAELKEDAKNREIKGSQS